MASAALLQRLAKLNQRWLVLEDVFIPDEQRVGLDFIRNRDDLLSAIHQALERDRDARRTRAADAEVTAQLEKLTARERDVLELVVAGRLNKEIAATLGIVEQTVKQHRGRIMRKLGARSVTDLVRFAEHASRISPK